MKTVDPAELSALLDGEISPERTEQVHRALAENSELRSVFESLSAIHKELATCAVAVRFQPRISLASSTRVSAVVLGIALVMLVLRVMTKLVPLGVAAMLQAVALVLVLWWVSFYLLRLVHEERWWFMRSEVPNMN